MSFIIAARLITRGCRSQRVSINFNSITQKISSDKKFFKIFTPVTQKRWFSDKTTIKTNTSCDLEHIYYGKIKQKIKLIKILSCSTSLFSLIIQPYILFYFLENKSVALAITSGILLTAYIVITPLLLHMLTKKYVNDIYYNKNTNTYIASTFTIFAREKKIEFTPDDVEQPGLGQVLTNCHIKGRPMLIDFVNFLNPHHYAIIMGYDKPMNFRFENNINNNNNNNNKQQIEEVNEKKSMRN